MTVQVVETPATKEVVREKVTVLSPAEAFRLARLASPWTRGTYYVGEKSCAIGAIAEATGLRYVKRDDVR